MHRARWVVRWEIGCDDYRAMYALACGKHTMTQFRCILCDCVRVIVAYNWNGIRNNN